MEQSTLKSGNVVHINDTAHARAKAFCQKRGIRMKDWVSGLILQRVCEHVCTLKLIPSVLNQSACSECGRIHTRRRTREPWVATDRFIPRKESDNNEGVHSDGT